MVEVALGSLLFVVFISIFGGYYETAISKIIDLSVLFITKVLSALKSIEQPTEEGEQQ